jgi:E3 ubiquitin-protein ligase UBR7
MCSSLVIFDIFLMSVPDQMIQCIICEDWYHGRHISEKKIPDNSSYSEMICGTCMNEHDFLFDYVGHAVEIVDDSSIADTTLNITSLDESLKDDEESAAKKIKLSDDACIRPSNTLPVINKEFGKFWKEGWRNELCKCTKCTKMYQDQKVEYLCDPEDTTQFYEEKGKAKPKTSSYDSSLAALSSLPRVNQIDAISSYNQMKEKLFEYLQTFVINRRIVTEDDIKKFFETMKESDNTNVHQPHFCR